MIGKFSSKAQNAITVAESIAFEKGHDKVETHHLFLAILRQENDLTQYLFKNYCDTNYIKNEINERFPEKDIQPFYMECSERVKNLLSFLVSKNQSSQEEISINELCIGLIKSDTMIQELLEDEDIDITQLLTVLGDADNNFSTIKGCETFVEFIQPSEEKLILGRDKEVSQMIVGLSCCEKSNIAILGHAGVGKTAIVEELARILRYNPPKKLVGYKVISLDVNGAVAGTKYRGEFEDKVRKFLDAIKGQKYIIFIDEAHSITQVGGCEGSTSLSEILKPILTQGQYKFIIATTDEEYKTYVSSNKALSRRFRSILVKEPAIKDLPNMLSRKIDKYSHFHNVKITKKDIGTVISLAKTIPHRYFPDKALDIIDYTMSYCEYNGINRFDMDFAKEYIDGIIG